MLGKQVRLWRAMRIKRSFTLDDLILVTETGRDYADHYVGVLRRAGYLHKRGRHIIVLIRDSGPKPPQVLFHYAPGVRRRVGVFDRNTLTTYGLDGAEPPAMPVPKARKPRVVDPPPRRPRLKNRKAGRARKAGAT